MKKILGLDLGTTSIGWALVNEAESEKEISEILKTGVRVIPLTTDEETDFQKGKSTSINADRTLKRGARRNLQRYKQRRTELIKLLKGANLITDDSVLTEEGKDTTHSLWALRAQAATEEIALQDFARVLLSINKKRGYKSNRKAKDEGDGQAIDGIEVAMKLYENNQTPGVYALNRLNEGKKHLPDFYRSDLYTEFDRVWEQQKTYYPTLLTDELKAELTDKHKTATWAICSKPFNIDGKIQKGTAAQKRLEVYEWRAKALKEQIDLEQLAIVLSEINGQISGSSGYLGAISDRSKQLIIDKITVGQFLYGQLEKNPHTRLKNQVFYRQDYLDEFEHIWETQAKFHPELTPKLKEELRDVVIFYQRRLKSQKGQLSICELEQHQVQVEVDGKLKTKTVGPKVCPKSSPLFQEFKIWQILNNLELRPKEGNDEFLEETFIQGVSANDKTWVLDLELKQHLFNKLNLTDKLTSTQVLKEIGLNNKKWELNYKEDIEGNRTNAKLYDAYSKILVQAGYEPLDMSKWNAERITSTVKEVFNTLGINTAILDFNVELEGVELEKQPAYLFWHLLYSYEGDNSRTGDEALLKRLKDNFGFDEEYGKLLANVTFQDDHGSLSTRAIRKILPELKKGFDYYQACDNVGYNHSHSVTAEENKNRVLKDALELLPKNSLRNPIVEKILNQMVNVVNRIIEVYGKPDEIRVELARELKYSAKEREEMTKNIVSATKLHDTYRKELKALYPFNSGVRITRNDIIKYKLYMELAGNGYHTIYTNTYVPKEKLFSKEFDIEHIIPQARLFDDSFSNKTLSVRQINLDKSNTTAYDFLAQKYGEESKQFKDYLARVEKLYKDGIISKSKHTKLLMKEADIPDGFIERDLRNTQYISKKATAMLLEIARTVTPTTGMVTDRLRQDWQLVNVLQELNWNKYEKLGLTTTEINKDQKPIKKIKDWTKRNDHRHHAMDAIAVAFTRPSHIQYLNYLNARRDEDHKKHKNIFQIEQKETFINEKKKRLFIPPIPLDDFRKQAKLHLENTLISFKAKNKVVTKNKNRIKKGTGHFTKIELTPRGQLHKETVYGKTQHYVYKTEKVGSQFDEAKIVTVVKKVEREALLERLHRFDNDPKKAFGGKNALDKSPIFLDKHQSVQLDAQVKVGWLEDRFTIRKPIGPDLKIEKVTDDGVKQVLQKHLDKFGGDPKLAFSNLEENPVWMNKEKGIQLKRVTISGVSNAEPLHYKKDNKGELILDTDGKRIATDYVQTGNNHHVAIYSNAKGIYSDHAVSFSDAVKRRRLELPIVIKDTNLVWTEVVNRGIDDQDFLETLPNHNLKLNYSLKQNEYFVLGMSTEDFNENLKHENFAEISQYLYTTWATAKNDYWFKHHLETRNTDLKKMEGAKEAKLYHRCGTNSFIKLNPIKVRINHIGQIVHVGEY